MAQFPGQSGSFVPTTNVWDPSEIYSVDVNSNQFKELLVRMYQNLNIMSVVLNSKDTGIYSQQSIVNGQIWWPATGTNSTTARNPVQRQVIRKVINFGSLPNAGTKSVPHGIDVDSQTTFTHIYATASDTTGLNYIPIPYASTTLLENVELKVDNLDITINTGIDRTNYNVCYVILEYLVT